MLLILFFINTLLYQKKEWKGSIYMGETFDIPSSAIPLLRGKLDRFIELDKSISKLMNCSFVFPTDDLDLLCSCIDLAIKQKEKDLLICKDLIEDDKKVANILAELREGEEG